MRVLVIYLSEYNGLSSSAKRMLGLVRGLVENNHDVVLLTTEFKNRKIDDETQKTLQKIRIIPVESNGYSVNSQKGKDAVKTKIKAVLGTLYRLVRIFGHTEKLAHKTKLSDLPYCKYDCVISVSDPKTSHILLEVLLKQGLSSKKIVEYWGDPLYGDITFKSIYPDSYIRTLEERMLGLADSVVYTSPFTVEQERKLFPQFSSKMRFVPTASVERIFQRETGDSSFTVGYYGAYHSEVRNLKPLYNTFYKKTCRDAKLNIIGDSNLKFTPTENIVVLPRGNIAQYEANSDVLVCVLNKKGTQIPGKLYYNASTNKAVLVILDGEEIQKMKQFLMSFKRFYFCENTEEDIANAIDLIRKEKKNWTPCEMLKPTAVAKMVVED